MDDEMTEQAEQIVTLIRSQNWKNGGVLSIDRGEAIAAVIQAMKAAYSKGLLDAARHTSKIMMQAFDAASGGNIKA